MRGRVAGALSRRRPGRSRGAAARALRAVCAALGLAGASMSWAADGAASAFYENALQRFHADDFDGAVLQLKNALQQAPDHLSARVLLGRAYLALGDAPAAAESLERALRTGADPNLVLVPLARAELLQGSYEKILERAERGDLSVAVRRDLLLMRGQAALQLGRSEVALDAFQGAAALTPEDASPLLGASRVALQHGDLPRALELAHRAAERSPGDAEAWFLSAELSRMQGQLDAALEDYDRAVALDPHHLAARNNRAAVLVDLGRDAAAVPDLEAVRKAIPHDPQAALLLALTRARAGDMAGARAALETAADTLDELDPRFIARHRQSLLMLGMVRSAQGQLEEAARYLERYIDDYPFNDGARRLLAGVLIGLGEPARAVHALAPLSSRTTEDPEVHLLLARAHLARGDLAAALAALERAAPSATDDARVLRELGELWLAAGDARRAASAWRAARALRPDDARIGTQLGEVLIRLGEHDEALALAHALEARRPGTAPGPQLAGEAALARGDLPGARAHFERALAFEPSSLAARRGLAAVDLHDGRGARARSRYLAILEDHPTDESSMIGLSRAAEAEGRTADAIRWLERVRDSGAAGTPEYLRLVDLYLGAADVHAARRVADAFEAKDPENVSAVIAAVRVRLAEGRREHAVARLREASLMSRASPRDLYRLARMQVENGDADGARASLVRALELFPGLLVAEAAIVDLDLRAGRHDAGLERATRLRDRHPQRAIGHVLRGDALLALARAGDAVAAYERALSLERSPGLIVRLARAYVQSGATGSAFELLEQWHASDRSEPVVARELAVSYVEHRRYEDAVLMHERLLERSPRDGAVLNNLAWLHRRTGRASSALELARRAVELMPDDAATLDTYGWLLVLDDQPRRGLPYLREAVHRAAHEPQVRYHLAVALSRLDLDEEAKREVTTALESRRSFEGIEDARALLRALSGERAPRGKRAISTARDASNRRIPPL